MLKSKNSRKSIESQDIEDAAGVASQQTIAGIDMNNLSDIDLNADYSDDDD